MIELLLKKESAAQIKTELLAQAAEAETYAADSESMSPLAQNELHGLQKTPRKQVTIKHR